LIAQLAAAHGKKLEPQLISAGGASLRRHWNAGAARAAIESGAFQYVVLQEQSTLPIRSPQRMHESIRDFDQAIKAAGAQTVLYLTWARRDAPESQQGITDAYTQIGGALDAILVPVGVAWEKLLKEHAHPELHDADGSHPTLAGSYLAACVFHAVLFKQRPHATNRTLTALNPADQGRLQKVAWDGVGR
jgi:hypothetical protein